MPTWSAGIKLKGAAGNSIRSGTGAPTSSNPAVQFDGDFFLQTDGNPPVLYGPRANGVWPASGISTGGTIIRSSQGVPQPTLGNVGDFALDMLNGFFYGPKTSDNGWLGTQPINVTGPQGASGLNQPSFGTFSNSYGPAAYIGSASLSGTGTAMLMNVASSVPHVFVPVAASAFMGGQITNFGTSAAAVQFQLVNLTTNTVIFTSAALAKGTVSTIPTQTTTAYPLVAGNQYQWQALGSGSSSCYIVPQYLQQCGASQGVQVYAPFTLANVTLSGTAQNMTPPGIPAQQQYYRNNVTGYLYSMQVQATGTASASVTFGGFVSAAVTAANSPQTFGPFVAASNVLSAATNYTATVTGSGTGSVVMVPSIVS